MRTISKKLMQNMKDQDSKHERKIKDQLGKHKL